MSDMRLIDANALCSYLNEWSRKLHAGTYHNDAVIMDVLTSIYEHVGNMPTIDADAYFDAADRIKPCPKCRYQIFGSESVRRGEWLIKDVVIDNNGRTMPDWPRCSKCNRQSDLEYDFCPNCGAKMDLEAQDDD